MIHELNLAVSPENLYDNGSLKSLAAGKLALSGSDIRHVEVLKRSLDARNKNVIYNLTLKVYTHDSLFEDQPIHFDFADVRDRRPVLIVGAGPGGLFAALRLLQQGFRPVLIERGKDVSERKKDVAGISKFQSVNPDSNYCFGEGGAGTFSDGKLYTRSTKKGDVGLVLKLLCFHGADKEILIDSHPHIGSDKLPEIVKNIRKTIIDHGGEIYFNEKLTDIIIRDDSVKGIVTEKGSRFETDHIILATGHSASDIYELLLRKNLSLEPKAFALGVRVEHPQALIDKIQYHRNGRGDFLPAASYSLVAQSGKRGVYSFCMCPGGFVVPSATSEGSVVVNGMSPFLRNSPFANSGIVVEIRKEDIPGFSFENCLAGLEFQQKLEKMAFESIGSGQKAPVQRLTDFINGKTSQNIPKTSYSPGVVSSEINRWLPDFIYNRLKDGFAQFDKRMRGFLTSEAVIYGVESRTSSPVRIVRDKETLMHPQLNGLYPCGEGAGYSGGIVSSAIDGINCADRIAEKNAK